MAREKSSSACVSSASMFASVIARRRSDEALRAALAEVKRLSEQLRVENVYLRREVDSTLDMADVVDKSAAIRRVQEQVRQVAETDATVLLLGETGSGKELFASQIHELSRRRARAMVRVNCAAIPATLIESELFGREKGAYTGALSRQIGRFELADGSTIFLDEIGDLPLRSRSSCCACWRTQIERLGGTQGDRRSICASSPPRIAISRTDRGRHVPRGSLLPAERLSDSGAAAARADRGHPARWSGASSRSSRKRSASASSRSPKDKMDVLQRYAWPGNVRELRNVVERAMIVANGPRLTIALPQGRPPPRDAASCSPTWRGSTSGACSRAPLADTRRRGAAERLGLKPTTLETRMAKLGLRRPRH